MVIYSVQYSCAVKTSGGKKVMEKKKTEMNKQRRKMRILYLEEYEKWREGEKGMWGVGDAQFRIGRPLRWSCC